MFYRSAIRTCCYHFREDHIYCIATLKQRKTSDYFTRMYKSFDLHNSHLKVIYGHIIGLCLQYE